jgi:hypothetical protein
MGKVHVYRAGNSKEGTTEERKKAIIKTLLDKDDYSKAIMYDDAKPNLHTFMELKREHPQIKFYAWHVSLEGEASEYMREDIMSERKKRKRSSRWAAYGPGPYGGYGYDAGYSGDGGVGEASYPGNVGMIEVAKFFKVATDAQKKLFKELLEKGKRGLAWKLIQDVTDTKLQGQEFDEAWSQKYKRSINCSNPRGFSQKAHCAGRKKKEGIEEGFQQRTVDKLSELGMQGPYSKRDLVGMSSAWSKTLSGIKSSQIIVQDASDPRHSAWIAPAGGGQWMVGAEDGYMIKSGPEALKRLQFFLQPTNEEWDDDEEGDVMRLHDHLSYPEVVDRISGMMRAMGWKVRRKGDDDYIFLTRGQLKDEWYTVSIGKTADGKGFTYALGTIEEGDPHIGQQDTMPNTVASVSMLADEIRDGFGMNENFADGKKKGKSRPGRVKRAGVPSGASISRLRQIAKTSSGEKAKMAHWMANMKSGKKKANR